MSNKVSAELQVLVVDDEPIIQELVKVVVRKMGFAGVVVKNGDEALRCLAQRHFDLVLMDVEMPILDGLATLAAIREGEKTGSRRLPVVMMTGHDLPGDRERFFSFGADGHVSKPLNLGAMIAEIKRVLKL